MNYSDSSVLADTRAPRHRRGRRLVLYLSLTLLVPLFVGLAVRLGASAPAKTPPQSPGGAARIPSPDMPQALREPEPLLTLKAEDVPLLKSIQERQMQLDERDKQLANRAKQLANREADLRLVQQQIEDKLTTLALLRKEMGDLLQEKAAFEEKRFEHLVKVYEVMKPEEVSSLFERLNEDTAARLLYQMKEKKAGQILASISPQVAAKLSERLAAQRQQETQHTPVKEKR
jgi:flagellar motility protein MotE (MotC chaperone)